jgi:hypothetical protein
MLKGDKDMKKYFCLAFAGMPLSLLCTDNLILCAIGVAYIVLLLWIAKDIVKAAYEEEQGNGGAKRD